MNDLSTISDSSIIELTKRNIYFAHMSVGYEIIDGFMMLAEENPSWKFNIVDSKNINELESPFFAHSKIGENREPKFKIDDFISVLDSGFGEKTDIAFLKFCFVDVDRYRDIDEMFTYYVDATEKIEKAYPELKLLHFTVPIRIKPDDWKGKINMYLVRDHNIRRNQFNDMLRNHFPEEELYDIALIQSTLSDGSRCKYTMYGKDVFILNPELTYDGGHLNKKGSKLAAEQLLFKMAKLYE